jgi:hypothetical protein
MKMILIREQFRERFQYKVHDAEEFMSKTVWSDEAIFKLNGTVNYHNCVYWAPEYPHIPLAKVVTYQGCLVWTVTQGFNWTILFRRNSCWPYVPQHALDIHFTHHSSALWE